PGCANACLPGDCSTDKPPNMPDGAAMNPTAAFATAEYRDTNARAQSVRPGRDTLLRPARKAGGAPSILELALVEVAVVLDPRDAQALHAGAIDRALPR